MSRQSLDAAIREGERLLIDSPALIAYLDQREAVSAVATRVIDEFVSTGRNAAVISTVSVTEMLIRPLRTGVHEPYRHIIDFVTRLPNLRALPVDLYVAQEAANIRATYNLGVADALIAATGIVAQVAHLVTNNERWVRKLQPLSRRITVVYLNRYA